MSKRNGIYILSPQFFASVYGPDELAAISRRLQIEPVAYSEDDIRGNLHLMEDVDYIFASWGMMVMDEAFMVACPQLKGIFYSAGSVKSFVTDAFWDRDIPLSSAWGANGIPVAEFTFAQIILSLKRVRYLNLAYSRERTLPDRTGVRIPGAFGSTVGLVSLGQIGRLVAEKLQTLQVNIIAYDPFASVEEMASLGIEKVELAELFARADVVSCHTPWLPETEGMLTYEHFSSMPGGATFINTARGAVVNETGLIKALQERPDLTAALDVTYPEPPAASSPLYAMDNVLLTPHIAGSVDDECRRMVHYMIEEYDRLIAGQPLKWRVTREKAVAMA